MNQSRKSDYFVGGLFVRWSDYLSLDKNFFSKILFENTQILGIRGTIKHIDANVFRGFLKLKEIQLNLLNLKTLIKQGIGWVKSINFDLKNMTDFKQKNRRRVVLSLEQVFDNSFPFLDLYTYPEEDFCVFVDFPFDQMIFLSISLTKKPLDFTKCSCTLIWIAGYYKYNNQIDDFDSLKINLSFYCKNNNYSYYFDICNFDKKTRNCLQNRNTDESNSMINVYENNIYDRNIIYTYASSVFISPMLSIIGLIINLMVIYAYLDRRNKENFEKVQYKHMFILAITNCAYCFISIFSLIKECPYHGNGLFCSAISDNILVKYLKVLIFSLLLSILRYISNFSNIQFSINRYLLVGKNHNKILIAISQINIKKFYALAIIFGTLLSSNKYFAFKDVSEFGEEDYYVIIDSSNGSRKNIFRYINVVSESINNGFFSIFYLMIDASLVRKFKQTVIEQSETKKHALTFDAIKSNLNEKVQRKTHFILIINLISNLFLKLPELYYLMLSFFQQILEMTLIVIILSIHLRSDSAC